MNSQLTEPDTPVARQCAAVDVDANAPVELVLGGQAPFREPLV